MKKILVHDEQEYFAIFNEMIDDDFENVEKFLWIEFPYVDGTFPSDVKWDITPDFDDSQAIDTTKYRKSPDAEECSFPSEYPCLVFFAYDDDIDRFGRTHFEMLEFVYPSDFLRA